MKQLLSFIIDNIAPEPKSVEIDQSTQDNFTQLVVKADELQLPRLIGRQGKVVKAMRNILRIKAIKTNQRFSLTLTQP